MCRCRLATGYVCSDERDVRRGRGRCLSDRRLAACAGTPGVRSTAGGESDGVCHEARQLGCVGIGGCFICRRGGRFDLPKLRSLHESLGFCGQARAAQRTLRPVPGAEDAVGRERSHFHQNATPCYARARRVKTSGRKARVRGAEATSVRVLVGAGER